MGRGKGTLAVGLLAGPCATQKADRSDAWVDVARHLRVLQKMQMAVFQTCLHVNAYLKGPVTNLTNPALKDFSF